MAVGRGVVLGSTGVAVGVGVKVGGTAVGGTGVSIGGAAVGGTGVSVGGVVGGGVDVPAGVTGPQLMTRAEARTTTHNR